MPPREHVAELIGIDRPGASSVVFPDDDNGTPFAQLWKRLRTAASNARLLYRRSRQPRQKAGFRPARRRKRQS
jgi:hypothetical protein